MKRAGCPECKCITELDEHEKKWNGRQVYKCTKCGTLLLECWECERMARVGDIWDDAYCDQCTPKVMRKTTRKRKGKRA